MGNGFPCQREVLTSQARKLFTELLFTQFSLTATNTLALGWPTVLGAEYQVESADQLGTPEWHDVGGLITAQTTNAILILPFDITTNAQFYRVRQVLSP